MTAITDCWRIMYIPYLGDKKLRSIKTKTVDDYYHFLETEAEPATNMGKPMRDHITAATIHDIHKVLRCAFNLAVRWEYINKNPFLNATLPEHHEKERVILEPEQILKVLEFTNRPEYYDYYLIHCAVLIAIGCTVRGGEIGGLQWDKINFEKQIILFDRAIDRVSKKNMDMPKMNILLQVSVKGWPARWMISLMAKASVIHRKMIKMRQIPQNRYCSSL